MSKRDPKAKFNSPPLLLSIEDAAMRLDLSPSTIKRLIRQGQLRSVKIRHTRRIVAASLDEYIAELERGQP